MKAIRIILIIILVFMLALTGIYAYYGGFSSIHISESYQGGETVVYETVSGDYSQTTEVTDRIYYALLNDFHIQTKKGFGIFYDNPQQVEKRKLRSESGCMLDNLPDSTIMADISKRFNVKTLPEGNYITAELPMKGSLSIFVGLMKVYPAINKYMEEKGISDTTPVTEIYDITNGKIIYRKQITNDN